MKQLLIVNSAKALNAKVGGQTISNANDLSLLDAGAISFFKVSDNTLLSAAPTANFGIALGKGANYPAFVIPEVDVNTLSVTVAQPAAGNVFQTKFTFPTPEVGKEYAVVVVKKGVVPNERNSWYTSIVAKTTTAATEAASLVDAIKAKTNDMFAVTASNSGAVVTIEGLNVGEGWAVQLVDGLSGAALVSNFPVEAKPNIGDTAYIKDLAQRCAADKGFVYLDGESKDIYPGYPEAVEEIAQADIATKGYVVFNLHFATKRESGKTGDEQVWQYVHIAVPKNITGETTLSTIEAILGQPVLVNEEE